MHGRFAQQIASPHFFRKWALTSTYSKNQRRFTLPSFIRNPKDFWSGVMFIVFGLAAVIIARDYAMGSAGRMGPAYFPTALGWILAALGATGVLRSFLTAGEPVEKFAIRELFLILLSVILFGILVRGAGLVIAVLISIVLSAYASPKFRWKSVGILAVGMAVFAVLLFVKALGLPMPILGSWFGY
jgi:hypothetical protein